MKLSIIVVNYNVRFFLEQCLQSVFLATKNIDAEVFVVDNNSVDGSVAMVREKFPQAILIENEQNLGFSTANNIAIKKALGEYILLLNPDTVVEEDTFSKVLAYMDSHPDAGALGVKMIDGKGNFLPESKRGLPTPWVAFYKIFGLSKIFPQSKKFGKYHLSYLDKESTHTIDVLCGAFMLMRKTVLDKTGLLDETFFMYGEDIDLSYRIQKVGYKNIYYPETTIIHYKGESTRKSSLNYVYLFYKAMQIFAKKHLSGGGAKWLSVFIHMAIYLRASVSMVKRIALRFILPVLDVILIYTGIFFLASYWSGFWFDNPNYYSSSFFWYFVPACIAVWFISLLFSGAYDSPLRFRNIFTGISVGTVIILIGYALLPQDYRYSRIMILLGAMLVIVVASFNRWLLSLSGIPQYSLQFKIHKKIIIVGNLQECLRVESILEKLKIQSDYLAFVSPAKEHSNQFIGSLAQIQEVVRIHTINEVIFCSGDISASTIIDQMLSLSNVGCDFKIAPVNSDSIIGSNSINTAGDLYVHSINSVASLKNIRLKRTFDILTSLILLISFPVWIWKKPLQTLKAILAVLFNKKSWIGYSDTLHKITNTPKLKRGIFAISDAYPESKNNPDLKEKLDLSYAQDYRPSTDLRIFMKCFFSHLK
jgi:GT2 family glycosyltransferase